MGTLFRTLCLGVGWIVVTGCVSSPGALAPCDPQSPDRPICHVTNPEDLGLLADRSWVVVSEMAPNEADPDEAAPNESAPNESATGGTEAGGETRREHGQLTAIRLLDLESEVLYPTRAEEETNGSSSDNEAANEWGDPSCPGPPDPDIFQPHGIDVGSGADGRPALAVVNHGGREAVELFEIVEGATPSLVWRGCVPMPEDVMANDVAFFLGGGFVVTNFMPRFESVGLGAIWSVLKISMGARTGSVLRWEPGGEVVEIENSGGSAPNGVEVSADGSEIFVAEWGGGRVYRLKLDGEGSPQRDEVVVEQNPDNLTWTRDGKLLLAGQHGGVTTSLGCSGVRDAGCDLGYSVYLVSPDSLEATKILEGRGAASVALEVGDKIFIGSFVGDQIMRVPSPGDERPLPAETD
jgi:hypothetical protein